jgi:electron transfer flavoprotein beta subunit
MPLKLLVAVKRVEDPESRIRVRPDGTGVTTEGMSYRMNPFDEVALEEALRLRERHGGELVAVSAGGEGCRAELRAAMAMGADRAILLRHDGPLDASGVSRLLALLSARERPDLILLGKQAIDDDQGQTGAYLAERLNWPQATCASKAEPLDGEAERMREPGLKVSGDGKELTVIREVDGGVETLAVELPAIVTTELHLNKPRFAALSSVLRSKKRPVEELMASTLSAELSPRILVRHLLESRARKGGIRVADVEELYRKLHEEAKVI